MLVSLALCFSENGGSIATLTLAQRAPPAAAVTFKSCLLTSATQRSVNAASSSCWCADVVWETRVSGGTCQRFQTKVASFLFLVSCRANALPCCQSSVSAQDSRPPQEFDTPTVPPSSASNDHEAVCSKLACLQLPSDIEGCTNFQPTSI